MAPEPPIEPHELDILREAGSIRITNREIYDALIDLKDRVAGVERRVDAVLTENVELRGRVRALELRFYAVLAGLVGALGIIGSKVIGA